MTLFDTLLKSYPREISGERAGIILERAKRRQLRAADGVTQARQALGTAIIEAQYRGTDEGACTKEHKALDAAVAEEASAARGIEAALAIQKASKAAEQAATKKAQIAVSAKHLEERDASGDRLSAALSVVATEWRTVLDESAKARNSYPGPWPGGSACSAGELREAVMSEIYRLCGDAVVNARSFPGGRPPSLMTVAQPEAIQPLPEFLRQCSKHALDQLNSQQEK